MRQSLTTPIWSLLLAAALSGCNGGGGPNTERSFRAVLIEPTPGSEGRGCESAAATCLDTVRITFNAAIDTTAILDDETPRYFLATLGGVGFQLDVQGTTLSNEGRTLVIPFQFTADNRYEFTLLEAVDTMGNRLENTAATSFRMGPCKNACP